MAGTEDFGDGDIYMAGTEDFGDGEISRKYSIFKHRRSTSGQPLHLSATGVEPTIKGLNRASQNPASRFSQANPQRTSNFNQQGSSTSQPKTFTPASSKQGTTSSERPHGWPDDPPDMAARIAKVKAITPYVLPDVAVRIARLQHMLETRRRQRQQHHQPNRQPSRPWQPRNRLNNRRRQKLTNLRPVGFHPSHGYGQRNRGVGNVSNQGQRNQGVGNVSNRGQRNQGVSNVSNQGKPVALAGFSTTQAKGGTAKPSTSAQVSVSLSKKSPQFGSSRVSGSGPVSGRTKPAATATSTLTLSTAEKDGVSVFSTGLGRATHTAGSSVSVKEEPDTDTLPEAVQTSGQAVEDITDFSDKVDKFIQAQIAENTGKPLVDKAAAGYTVTSQPLNTISAEEENRQLASKLQDRMKLKAQADLCQIPFCTGGQKKHILEAHIPSVYYDFPLETTNDQRMSKKRLKGLYVLTEKLLGKDCNACDLVKFYNDNIKGRKYQLTNTLECAMRKLCKHVGWKQPKELSVCPVSHPAALIHWSCMFQLLARLTPTQRILFFMEFHNERLGHIGSNNPRLPPGMNPWSEDIRFRNRSDSETNAFVRESADKRETREDRAKAASDRSRSTVNSEGRQGEDRETGKPKENSEKDGRNRNTTRSEGDGQGGGVRYRDDRKSGRNVAGSLRDRGLGASESNRPRDRNEGDSHRDVGSRTRVGQREETKPAGGIVSAETVITASSGKNTATTASRTTQGTANSAGLSKPQSQVSKPSSEALGQFKTNVLETVGKPSQPQRLLGCGIPGCFTSGSEKQHCLTKHVPSVFHEFADSATVADPVLSENRITGLRILADEILGEGCYARDLVIFFNENIYVTMKSYSVSNRSISAMKELCEFAGWDIPPTFTVTPVNHPAALIHWAAMVRLLGHLKPSRRHLFYQRFHNPDYDANSANMTNAPYRTVPVKDIDGKVPGDEKIDSSDTLGDGGEKKKDLEDSDKGRHTTETGNQTGGNERDAVRCESEKSKQRNSRERERRKDSSEVDRHGTRSERDKQRTSRERERQRDRRTSRERERQRDRRTSRDRLRDRSGKSTERDRRRDGSHRGSERDRHRKDDDKERERGERARERSERDRHRKDDDKEKGKGERAKERSGRDRHFEQDRKRRNVDAHTDDLRATKRSRFSPSPERLTYSARRRFSRSPVRRLSPSPERFTPRYERSPSPGRFQENQARLTPSPERQFSHSLERRFSLSPERFSHSLERFQHSPERFYGPERGFSPSPERRLLLSPERRFSHGLERRFSVSPERRFSPRPERKYSLSPERRYSHSVERFGDVDDDYEEEYCYLDMPVQQLPQDVVIDDAFNDDMPLGQMPLDQMALNHMPLNQMPLNPVPLDQMPLVQMPLNQMPLDHMSLNQMPLNQMPLNQMQFHTQNVVLPGPGFYGVPASGMMMNVNRPVTSWALGPSEITPGQMSEGFPGRLPEGFNQGTENLRFHGNYSGLHPVGLSQGSGIVEMHDVDKGMQAEIATLHGADMDLELRRQEERPFGRFSDVLDDLEPQPMVLDDTVSDEPPMHGERQSHKFIEEVVELPAYTRLPGKGPSPRLPGKGPSPRLSGKDQSPRLPGKDQSPRLPGKDQSPRLPGKDQSPRLPGKDQSPRLPGKDLSPRLPGKDPSPRLPGKDLSPRLPGKDPSPRLPGKDKSPRLPGKDLSLKLSGKDPSPRLPGKDQSYPWKADKGLSPRLPEDRGNNRFIAGMNDKPGHSTRRGPIQSKSSMRKKPDPKPNDKQTGGLKDKLEDRRQNMRRHQDKSPIKSGPTSSDRLHARGGGRDWRPATLQSATVNVEQTAGNQDDIIILSDNEGDNDDASYFRGLLSSAVPPDEVGSRWAADKRSSRRAKYDMPSSSATEKRPSSRTADKMPSGRAKDEMPSGRTKDDMPSRRAGNEMPSGQRTDKRTPWWAADESPTKLAKDALFTGQAKDQIHSEHTSFQNRNFQRNQNVEGSSADFRGGETGRTRNDDLVGVGRNQSGRQQGHKPAGTDTDRRNSRQADIHQAAERKGLQMRQSQTYNQPGFDNRQSDAHVSHTGSNISKPSTEIQAVTESCESARNPAMESKIAAEMVDFEKSLSSQNSKPVQSEQSATGAGGSQLSWSQIRQLAHLQSSHHKTGGQEPEGTSKVGNQSVLTQPTDLERQASMSGQGRETGQQASAHGQSMTIHNQDRMRASAQDRAGIDKERSQPMTSQRMPGLDNRALMRHNDAGPGSRSLADRGRDVSPGGYNNRRVPDRNTDMSLIGPNRHVPDRNTDISLIGPNRHVPDRNTDMSLVGPNRHVPDRNTDMSLAGPNRHVPDLMQNDRVDSTVRRDSNFERDDARSRVPQDKARSGLTRDTDYGHCMDAPWPQVGGPGRNDPIEERQPYSDRSTQGQFTEGHRRQPYSDRSRHGHFTEGHRRQPYSDRSTQGQFTEGHRNVARGYCSPVKSGDFTGEQYPRATHMQPGDLNTARDRQQTQQQRPNIGDQRFSATESGPPFKSILKSREEGYKADSRGHRDDFNSVTRAEREEHFQGEVFSYARAEKMDSRSSMESRDYAGAADRSRADVTMVDDREGFSTGRFPGDRSTTGQGRPPIGGNRGQYRQEGHYGDRSRTETVLPPGRGHLNQDRLPSGGKHSSGTVISPSEGYRSRERTDRDIPAQPSKPVSLMSINVSPTKSASSSTLASRSTPQSEFSTPQSTSSACPKTSISSTPQTASSSTVKGFDCYFHLDSTVKRIQTMTGHSGSMQVEDVLQFKCKFEPRLEVDLFGGIIVYNDPETYKNIEFPLNSKWKVAIGIDPKKVKHLNEDRFALLQSLLYNPLVGALGGVGLDMTVNDAGVKVQESALLRVLGLCTPKRPLLLHIRERPGPATYVAHEKCLRIAQQKCKPNQRIMLHCFTGDTQTVNDWIAAFPNCMFSYSNNVERFAYGEKAGLRAVPLSKLLLETTSPFFSHVGQYKDICTPAHLGVVAQKVSDIKLIPPEVLLAESLKNACWFFGM